jgi:hypothetical protein
MKSRFLPNKKEDSILHYYGLPLVGLNKSSFHDNLKSVKINFDGTVIFVEVVQDIYSDILYPNKIKYEDTTYLFFKIPNHLLDDSRKIVEGKYSQLSIAAKKKIHDLSELYNNTLVGGNYITSKLIFALDKSPTLINYMYEILKSPYEKGDKFNSELWKLLCKGELTEKLSEEDFYFNVEEEIYGV